MSATSSADAPGRSPDVSPPRLANRVKARIPALLRDTVFRRYWSAQAISMFGDQISAIAIPLVAVLVLHANAADMGYLTALVWLPSLIFGLHAGAWVDRRGHRRGTMIAADLGRFVLLASIPTAFALHMLTLPQLFLVALGEGMLSVLFTVANSAVFVAIVPADQYLDGNTLIYASRALSFVGGPSVGGLLVQLFTAPFAVVADALSFLGSAFFLRRIQPVEPQPDRGGKGSVTAGARFMIRSPIVRQSLIAVAVINFFNLMFSALYLLYAVRELHISAGLIGAVLGAAAVGGVLGSAVTKRLAVRIGVGWAFAAGCALFTAPLILVPLAGGPKLLVLGTLFVAEFVSGFGVMVLDISIGTIFAVVVPDELKSRVAGAFQAVNYGTRPLGALLGGLLGTQLGLRDALWVATAGGVIGFFLLLPSPVPSFRIPDVSGVFDVPGLSSVPGDSQPGAGEQAVTGRREGAAGRVVPGTGADGSASAELAAVREPVDRQHVRESADPGGEALRVR